VFDKNKFATMPFQLLLQVFDLFYHFTGLIPMRSTLQMQSCTR